MERICKKILNSNWTWIVFFCRFHAVKSKILYRQDSSIIDIQSMQNLTQIQYKLFRQAMDKMQHQNRQDLVKKLSIKSVISNFFLLHDFFYKFTKIKSTSAQFFDQQFDVSNSMIYATRSGGRYGQGIPFAALFIYFIKGNSIKLRFLYGFLYAYWIQHFNTLGSYAGVLLTLPGVYNRTNNFFKNRPQQHNYLADLSPYLDTNVQDTQQVLKKIFPEPTIIKQNSYHANEFYIKNRQKYIPQEDQIIKKQPSKLRYFDCFLTRYVYYSSTRWLERVLLFLQVKTF